MGENADVASNEHYILKMDLQHYYPKIKNDAPKQKSVMENIVVNTQDHKLYIIDEVENGEAKVRELTEEDIAKLPEAQQHVIRSLQLQAKALQELARIQEQATLELKQLEYLCEVEREFRHEIMQWVKLGWGYKPKLSMAKPHRAKQHWHRTRSFCVRKGYH